MRPVANEPLARHALAFVLAGGRGSRLLELTDRRAKPAVYFGGKSRIIDFALSNALNSGIRRIAVATQAQVHSSILFSQPSRIASVSRFGDATEPASRWSRPMTIGAETAPVRTSSLNAAPAMARSP